MLYLTCCSCNYNRELNINQIIDQNKFHSYYYRFQCDQEIFVILSSWNCRGFPNLFKLSLHRIISYLPFLSQFSRNQLDLNWKSSCVSLKFYQHFIYRSAESLLSILYPQNSIQHSKVIVLLESNGLVNYMLPFYFIHFLVIHSRVPSKIMYKWNENFVLLSK